MISIELARFKDKPLDYAQGNILDAHISFLPYFYEPEDLDKLLESSYELRYERKNIQRPFLNILP